MTRETDAEIAALRARIDQLERANTPQPGPDLKDWQPYDPTARMSMPRSAMAEMANAIPDHVVRDIALRDCRAPTGPSSAGAIPSSQQVSNVRLGGSVGGWAREIPLSNPPGTHLVDALCIADDIKSRSEGKS